jgi:hypothetical protein
MAWRILSVDGWDCLLHPVLLSLIVARWSSNNSEKMLSKRKPRCACGCPVIHFASKSASDAGTSITQINKKAQRDNLLLNVTFQIIAYRNPP